MSESKYEIKKLRKLKREAKINRKRAAKQNKIKQHWTIWRDNFTDDSVAMVEGLQACEALSRNIACLISSQSDYYYYFKLDEDGDLSRLCHFNELKNLWLKRNQNNIVEILKPVFSKNSNILLDHYNGEREDFIGYLDSVQKFDHRLIIKGKTYNFISDKFWGEFINTERLIVYAKSLSDSEKQGILNQKNFVFSFDTLVLAVEYGCRSYWKENWVNC